jgi:hypothetical protein
MDTIKQTELEKLIKSDTSFRYGVRKIYPFDRLRAGCF